MLRAARASRKSVPTVFSWFLSVIRFLFVPMTALRFAVSSSLETRRNANVLAVIVTDLKVIESLSCDIRCFQCAPCAK